MSDHNNPKEQMGGMAVLSSNQPLTGESWNDFYLRLAAEDIAKGVFDGHKPVL